MTDGSWRSFKPSDFPILSDFYIMMEDEFQQWSDTEKTLYTKEILQETLLSLHSICVGSDSVFFNGYTNVDGDGESITFCIKSLLEAGKQIQNPMMFNLLSFLSNELLTKGNAVAALDEFYLFLGNMRTVEYVRNFMKRVRKFNSNVVLASQNISDYFLPHIAEYTKPLFAIPTHKFYFNMGDVKQSEIIENLGITESEYALIAQPEQGSCLYKCGNERYNLQIKVPDYRKKLFGTGGGK
jgi:type IV secretory pathway VirB4 component